MKLLDGNAVSQERAEDLRTQIAELSVVPKIVIIRVGERADSKSYVNRKVMYAQTIGAEAEVRAFDESVTQDELRTSIEEINNDIATHGVIVQLPLPDHLDDRAIINTIDPSKDVDGLTDTNAGLLMNGGAGVVPATPRGVLSLLRAYDIDVAGKHVVIVGRSLLVGKSAALLFIKHNATVTVCHSRTENLMEHTKQADIIVVATGQQKFLTREHLKDGQVVVDVGIGVDENKKLVGDVDFDDVKDVVLAISPVPGGVGPMTVVSLFENLIDAAEKQSR